MIATAFQRSSALVGGRPARDGGILRVAHPGSSGHGQGPTQSGHAQMLSPEHRNSDAARRLGRSQTPTCHKRSDFGRVRRRARLAWTDARSRRVMGLADRAGAAVPELSHVHRIQKDVSFPFRLPFCCPLDTEPDQPPPEQLQIVQKPVPVPP